MAMVEALKHSGQPYIIGYFTPFYFCIILNCLIVFASLSVQEMF